MIKDRAFLERWEKEWMRGEAPDYLRNLRLFEALYEEARMLGVLPPQDRLEGLEKDIRLARALNVSSAS